MSFQTPRPKQPAVNLPKSIIMLSVVMIGIHIILSFRLLPFADPNAILIQFSFIPYHATEIWTYITYAFLHGSWMHLFVNIFWMAAFGSAIAWRFGNTRFLVYSAVCAVGGAVFHLITHLGELVPTVGASAAISGHMAGAMRFIFLAGGPLGGFRGNNVSSYQIPAISLKESFSNPQILTFLAVWFGLNLLIGLVGSAFILGSSIAWQAHIGGFLVGLLLFDFFDPIKRNPEITGYSEQESDN